MRLGKAAGQAVSAFAKGVIEVAAVPDVGGLGSQVLRNVMVKVAFVSKGAFPVDLQWWNGYDNDDYQFRQQLNSSNLPFVTNKHLRFHTWITERHSRFSS